MSEEKKRADLVFDAKDGYTFNLKQLRGSRMALTVMDKGHPRVCLIFFQEQAEYVGELLEAKKSGHVGTLEEIREEFCEGDDDPDAPFEFYIRDPSVGPDEP